MIFVRARWYDPSTGSFLSSDPMGYHDSSNLYAYAANDPVNGRDPSGEYVGEDSGGLRPGRDAEQWFFGDVREKLRPVTDALSNPYVQGALQMVGGCGEAALGVTAMSTGVGAVPGAFATAYGADLCIAGARTILTGKSHDTLFMQGTTGLLKKTGMSDENAQLLATGIDMFGGGITSARAAKSIRTASRLARDAEEAETGARFAAEVAESASGERAAAREMEFGAGSAVGCHCLAGDTPVSVAAGGAKPIEELRVGDRVTSTFVDPTHADGWTAVNTVNWHVVKLRMPNPDRQGDVEEIEMLRPVEWVVANGAYPGHTIEIQVRAGQFGDAQVVSVEAAPKIASGPGRVVLMTFAHHDELLSIHFAGVTEPLELTREHVVFSDTQRQWTKGADLKVGDRIRTRSGESTVASIGRKAPAAVFDLEVETDHSYYVTETKLLSHNCPKEYDVVRYGDKAHGFEKHHGVLDVWAKHNVPGYVSYGADTPAIVLSVPNHNATRRVFANWKKVSGYVGRVPWQDVTPREMLNLSEMMMDAARVPSEARTEYYSRFNRYIFRK